MKQNNLQPPKQQPWRQTANAIDQGTMDYDMITLNNEFNTLNSLIIIAELFRAVRELNNSLRQYRDERDVFTVYNNFVKNLNSYKFKN